MSGRGLDNGVAIDKIGCWRRHALAWLAQAFDPPVRHGTMAVEIRPEIEQFVFEISGRPEQHAVQVFASDGAN